MAIRSKLTTIINTNFILFLFFLTVFGCYFWFGNYILFFQENQFLFLYTGDYFRSFLIKPGGILELAGKFLTQFYYISFIGTSILAAVFTFLLLISSKLIKSLNFNGSTSLFLSLVPAFCLVLMQTSYYHFMEANLGYLIVLLLLQLSVYLIKKNAGFLVLLFFPLCYYLIGAYAWIFAVSFILYQIIFRNNSAKYLYSILLIPTAALMVFISKNFLLLQSYDQLIFFPLPSVNDPKYKLLFYCLSGYIVIIPLLSKLKFPGKVVVNNLNFVNIASISVVFVMGFTVYKSYNTQTTKVFNTEKLVFGQKWEEAIIINEGQPSGNLIGLYFYNVALAETGQLCDRLFHQKQDFNTGSLVLPWGNEHMGIGCYFYYTIGLVNEAQRWAYEDMIVNGKKPENLKMLVKTNLINANYCMAQKYINVLKSTFYYKDWAIVYEKMAVDTSLIKNNPEIMNERNNMPKGDFFIQVNSAQNNIPLLIESNPHNKRAVEYKLAWMMLSRDVEGVVNQIKTLKSLGYSRIPRHIEEAAMIYYNGKGVFPDLGGLIISNETVARFNQYVAAFKSNRQNMILAKEKLGTQFGNTFMYYYHFK